MTDAPAARPIHSQGLLLIGATVGILLAAVYLTSSIVQNENGGISAAVRTVGIGLAIWSLVRPKAGLYIISIEGFSLDYIKKIAVYYGTVSTGTIIEVLIVGMLAVLCTLVGIFIQAVAFRRYKISPLLWAVIGTAFLGTVAVLLAQQKTQGLEKAAENAFNGCVYIAIALPMSLLLPDRQQLCKLVNVQFFMATIWSLWGIKQYLIGFTQLEWFYAETGLSAVASEHMLKFADPRPFGFGSGMPNFSVISAYFCYGAWHVWHYRQHRKLFAVCSLIVFGGILASLQRTILILPLAVLICYYMLQNIRRSTATYVLCLGIWVFAVANADYLLLHLNDINNAIGLEGYWGQSMLNVNTYDARLYSWLRLHDPANYSLFGLPESLEAHDIVTQTLAHYGVVGVLLAFGLITYGAWFVHRTVLRVEDPTDRKFALFWLAVTLPSIGLGIIGGGNFFASPVNLQIWTFFGACICLAVNSRQVPVDSLKTLREITEDLQPVRPPVPMAARGQFASV